MYASKKYFEHLEEMGNVGKSLAITGVGVGIGAAAGFARKAQINVELSKKRKELMTVKDPSKKSRIERRIKQLEGLKRNVVKKATSKGTAIGASAALGRFLMLRGRKKKIQEIRKANKEKMESLNTLLKAQEIPFKAEKIKADIDKIAKMNVQDTERLKALEKQINDLAKQQGINPQYLNTLARQQTDAQLKKKVSKFKLLKGGKSE